MATPLYDKGRISPLKTHQHTLRMASPLATTVPILSSPFRLTELEEIQPSPRDDPQRMANLIIPIFSTHHPTWTDVQALLNILLTANARQLVIYKVNEEAQQLHQDNPKGTLNLAGEIHLTEPDWNPNAGSTTRE